MRRPAPSAPPGTIASEGPGRPSPGRPKVLVIRPQASHNRQAVAFQAGSDRGLDGRGAGRIERGEDHGGGLG
jgi:hypothetical protein